MNRTEGAISWANRTKNIYQVALANKLIKKFTKWNLQFLWVIKQGTKKTKIAATKLKEVDMKY